MGSAYANTGEPKERRALEPILGDRSEETLTRSSGPRERPTRPDKEDHNGSRPPVRPSRFQIDSARRHRLEAIPGVPTFGPSPWLSVSPQNQAPM
jgi:hypothetical protein